ncbi:hypothetical protein AAVH_39828, partial [Aphelenchoides avenae]
YCKYLCDTLCCSAKSVARVSPSELEKLKDCGWRSRFDSAKSSTYKKDGKHFNDVLAVVADVDGFVGMDT